MSDHRGIEQVAAWVTGAARITVLTGAGISTDSGIPDFRGPQGVWTKDPAAQQMFTIDAYVADPAVRILAWRRRREHAAWTAQPNAGHRALVDLEYTGRLCALVTQNIDGLHQRAGTDPARLVELHGTIFQAECLSCRRRIAMRDVLARVDRGEEDPPCSACGGILKSATVSFGQSLDPVLLDRAVRAARDCDLFLAVGTTLQVQPAASLAGVAVSGGARLLIVNRDPTPYDGVADARLADPIGEVLPRILALAAA